jgi:hypothetical protein
MRQSKRHTGFMGERSYFCGENAEKLFCRTATVTCPITAEKYKKQGSIGFSPLMEPFVIEDFLCYKLKGEGI